MASSPQLAAPARAAWRIWLRRLAPWLVTVVVVAWLLHEYPLSRIVDEMRRGDALAMVPFALVMTIGTLFLVACWDWWIAKGYLGDVGYWDMLRGKAGTSMLLAIGYAFGHGTYGVWIARATRATPMQAAATALFIAACDLAAVALVAGAAVWLGDDHVPESLASVARIVAPAVSGLLVLFVVIGPYQPLGELPRLLRPWSVLPRWRGLASIAGRSVNICLFIVVTWAAARGFGLPIPLWAMAAYLPLLILIGSLPINIGGFGAIQGAWVVVFRDYAEEPAILAFQFLWHVMVVGGLVVRGAPFIRRVVSEIETGSK